MEILLNRYRNLTVLLLVVIGQILLLAYQVKNNQDVRVIRVWAVSVVTPMARVLEFVRRNTIGIAEDYFVLVNVRDENVRLNKENGQLKLENQHLRNELSTADRVKALRVFQEKTPSRTLAARVIGNGTGANSQVVFIDRGSGSGILRGMPVVTPDGIVGKVLAAYPTASQVLLITDAMFAAGVVSQKNHVHGTLVGLGQNKCMVKYIQNEEKVEAGEMFYTSGDDRVFPKGMPAGKATVVRPGRDFQEIYVQPSGWTSGLEEVLVVIEGVHQDIPDVPPVATADIYMQPPPPVDAKQAQAASKEQPLFTEADKLKERYKKVGEAQGHKFGEGTPGSKVPDFNLDPDAAAKAAAARAAAAKAAAAAAAGLVAGAPGSGATGTPVVVPPKPAPAVVRPAPQLDANGNPIPPKPRPKPAVDANGNPITPATRAPGASPGVQTARPTTDAAGNPVAPIRRPALGANGNPVAAPRPQTATPGTAVDANGRIIQARPVTPAGTQATPPPVPKPKPAVTTPAGTTPLVPRTTSPGTSTAPNTTVQKPKPATGAPPTTQTAPKPKPASTAPQGSTSNPAGPRPAAPRVTTNDTTINKVTPAPAAARPKPAQQKDKNADQPQ